jgi:hypothetical protein
MGLYIFRIRKESAMFRRLFRAELCYDPEFAQWKAELSRPGRLTAVINIYRYRANLKLKLPQGWSKMTVPVMSVWG